MEQGYIHKQQQILNQNMTTEHRELALLYLFMDQTIKSHSVCRQLKNWKTNPEHT
jgi:hypothetical protein